MINFVIRYGISIVLTVIIWLMFIWTLDPIVAFVAVIVTAALLKEKVDESQDKD